MPRRDFLKGARVKISDHALKRCLVRTEVMTQEEYNKLKAEADSGDKEAKRTLKRERQIIEKKFRNSRLSKFLPTGAELRRERSGSKLTRCAFVAYKNGNTFTVVTAYLQGRRNDFWKLGNEKEVKLNEESISV